MRLAGLLLSFVAGLGCHASGEWTDCAIVDGNGASVPSECATYAMPLLAGRSSETIDVHVRRFRDPASRGQLWLLQGGPGATGSSLIPLALALRTRGLALDLYLPDHRGVGESHWLGCPMLAGRGEFRGDAELPACLDELLVRDGERLPGFTASEAARDLIAIIEATRKPADRLLVWGGSYGSYWGHRLLQLAPELIDGLILDGVCAGPACRLNDSDRTMDAGMHELFAACATDAFCSSRLGANPAAILDGIGARLVSCDGLAQPMMQTRRLLATMAARAPHLLPALVYRLNRCEARDVAAVQHFQNVVATPGPYDGNFSIMLQNHVVLSELTSAVPALVDAQRAEEGFAVSQGLTMRFARLDPIWPRTTHDPLADQYATTTRTAVLLRSGALDVLTPPALGDQAALGIRGPSVRRQVFPKSGHSLLLSSACGDAIFESFVRDPKAILDDSCLSLEGAVDFRGDTRSAQKLFAVDDAWDG